MDALPAGIQAAVRTGLYTGDVTRGLAEALATGADFVIPPGVYPFAGDLLECRRPGQRIVGTGGVLRRMARRDGIGLLVAAENVSLHGLRFDGTAPATEPSHRNDMIKVTGNTCRIVGLEVRGSQGSNLRVDGAQHCRVIRPVLTDAFQNNIIVCNAPTRDIVIESPVCRRTVTQNNIYVTASEGGTANGEVISQVVILDPLCADAADTGIELSYHCHDSRVSGGKVVNSRNPALLQRDGRRNRWENILVQTRRPSDQHRDYDGVAVIPLWEPASWDCDTDFENVIVQGRARRSAFYWGQSGIRRTNCSADAYALGDRPSADGSDRVGNGDLKAGAVANIAVRGGRIDGYAIGDNWNFDGTPQVRSNCVTSAVRFARCLRLFNCFNVTPIRSAIVDNRATGDQQEDIVLVGARLAPSGGRPDIGLVYDGNYLASEGGTSPDHALLLTRNSRFVEVPAKGKVALTAGMPPAGQYNIRVENTPAAFSVTVSAAGAIVGSVPGGSVNVAVENGRLVLHQRGHLPRPVWAKVSGPGIKALTVS